MSYLRDIWIAVLASSLVSAAFYVYFLVGMHNCNTKSRINSHNQERASIKECRVNRENFHKKYPVVLMIMQFR